MNDTDNSSSKANSDNPNHNKDDGHERQDPDGGFVSINQYRHKVLVTGRTVNQTDTDDQGQSIPPTPCPKRRKKVRHEKVADRTKNTNVKHVEVVQTGLRIIFF